MSPILPLLSWKITNACNYECRYHPHIHGMAEKDSTQAVLDFLQFSDIPWKISITGGEPFLFPIFVEVCQQLCQNHTISIDTNLSISRVIASFAEHINPDRVDFILASLHIEEREKTPKGVERFIQDIKLLQRKGFRLKASYVMYPPLIERFERDYHYFRAYGIPLVPKPFKGKYNDESYPASYGNDAHNIFSKYGGKNIQKKLIYNFKGVPCQAGHNLINLDHTGRITRCPSDRIPLGNLHEKHFQDVIYQAPQPCRVEHCYCFGADYALLDTARIKFLEAVRHYLKQNHSEAKHCFLQAINLQPDLDSAYYNLAVLDILNGNQKEAINWIKKAVQLNPKNAQYSKYLEILCDPMCQGYDSFEISYDLSQR